MDISRGDVVGDGEAHDDVVNVFFSNVFGNRTDDDCELALVIYALGDARQDDGFAICNERGARLQKDQWLGREVAAHLGSVVGVVFADADDLRGWQGRWQNMDVL